MLQFMQQTPPGSNRHFLREWRIERKMGQKELAEKARTYKSIISRIETGKHGLELDLLLRLCFALDIAPGQFFQNPKRPSLDAITRTDSDEKVARIADHVARLRADFRD